MTSATKPELWMTREFDAPKRLVFEAWSKAEYVSRWFTPSPLTTPRCEVDLRTGGVFRLVMRMPDGVEFPMDAKFIEVVPDERIVFAATIHGGVEVHTTVTFAENQGKTTLTVHQVYSHESDATRGANAGWTKTLDQLAEHLRSTRKEASMPEIVTFLTYNDEAEEAVRLYLSIFENGKIVNTLRVGEGGPGPKGSVLTVSFELFGRPFIALNGGPTFTFSQGISLFVSCDTQAEIDRYWTKLTDGGGKEIQCGWLVDKFGVSWQIVPKVLLGMIGDADAAKASRAMQAMMKMKKLDIAALKRAHEGG